MPRPTYGPTVKKRVLELLDTMLGYVNADFECIGCKFKWHWKDEETNKPKLIVETTLRDLVALGKAKSLDNRLQKAQIREALKRLEDFLEILVDHRADRQGAEDWNFTLTLWSKQDKALNILRAEQQWEVKRQQKLKPNRSELSKESSSRKARKRPGVSFYAPPLPRSHVSRPEHLNAVRELLLADVTPNTLVISAIYGMGGIGKSVLAAELVREEAVLDRFPDGVLWVTLGQEPDLLSMVNQWIRELRDFDYRPTTLEAASKHLGYLLADKQALLVVDDVWDSEHVKPFKILGAGCQLLVTTRATTLIGALRYDLDIMTKTQALELLSTYLRAPLKGEEFQFAEEFSEAVGYLPLALELAAALIEDGVTWGELLEDFRTEIACLENLAIEQTGTLGDPSVQKERSLLASFHLTLRQLSPEQLKQFAWLGVIAEDVSMTQEMAATLWSVTVRQGGAILRTLKNRALLLPQAHLQGQPVTYRVHDLVHDLAKNLLTKEQWIGDLSGLGLLIPDAHSQFLDRYLCQTENGKWSSLEDDGYLYRRLTWHMEQAQQPELIHQLLQETTDAGRNGWYEACDRLGQPAIFVTDLSRAWRLAEELYPADHSRSLELQVLYALIFSSLNSLASNIPAALMAVLIEKKNWLPAQGFAYAQQATEPGKRAEIIGVLAKYWPPVLLEQSLDLARGIENESLRASVLSDLVPHLPEGLLSEALEVVREIEDEVSRVHAFISLAPNLPEIVSEAINVTRGIDDDSSRSTALSSLAPHLSKGLLSEALEVTREIQDDSSRGSALSSLAPYLPEIVSEALEAACSIEDELSRARALGSLAPHLSEGLLSEALEVACEIDSEVCRAFAVSDLAPHLSEKLLSEALKVAREIEDEFARVSALSGLLPQLPEIVAEALEVVPGIVDEHSRSFAFLDLAPHLPERLLSKALEVARGIQSKESRAFALGFLVPNLPEIVSEVLEVALSVEMKYSQSILIRNLAPYLPEGLLSKALEVARGIQSEPSRVIALSVLAFHMPEIVFEALEAAHGIQFDSDRARVLSGLAPHLPEGLWSEVLEVARGIQDDHSRSYALSGLAPYLPECLWSEVLEVARGIQDDYSLSHVLKDLVPYLPERLLFEVLEVVRGIQDDYSPHVLRNLVPHLPERLLFEALEVARGIQDKSSRASALCDLAPYLLEIVPEALEAARGIEIESGRVYALSGLLPQLPEIVPEVLEAARGIENKSTRVYALSGLLPQLPEIVPEVLEAARKIEDETSRFYALIDLAPHLSEREFSEVLRVLFRIDDKFSVLSPLSILAPRLSKELLFEAFEFMRGIEDESSRASVLRDLVPHLPEEMLPKALKIACGIEDEYLRASVLSNLVPHLPEGLLFEALEVARGIQSVYFQADVFSNAIPKIPVRFLNICFVTEVLQITSYKGREAMFKDLSNLAPAFISLSDRMIVPAVAKVMKEVSEQWP